MTAWVRVGCEAGDCVEIHIGLTDVTLRSSERPEQLVVFSLEEWLGLWQAIHDRGEFAVGD